MFVIRTIQSEIKRTGIFIKQNTESLHKKKESAMQLSKWEIEELMGIRRDTYTRKNGAIRRR